MTLTGTRVQTMQILNDRLHKADDKNETLHEKKKNNAQTHILQVYNKLQFIKYTTNREPTVNQSQGERRVHKTSEARDKSITCQHMSKYCTACSRTYCNHNKSL